MTDSFRDRIPELPEGGRWYLSHSQAEAFAHCPVKWEMRYVHRWVPTGGQLKFDIGTAWHLVVATIRDVYAKGGESGDAWDAARMVADNIKEFVPGMAYDVDPEARMLWMLEGYKEAYADEAERWEYLETEKTLVAPLLPERGVYFLGFTDYRKRDRQTGEVTAGDTKTSAGKNVSQAYYANDIAFEPQFMRYVKALRLMGEEVARFEWDAARKDELKRKMTLEERFARVSKAPTDAAVEAAWDELRAIAVAIDETREGRRGVYSDVIPMFCKMRCDYMQPHQDANSTGRPLLQVVAEHGGYRQKGKIA